MVYTNGKLSLLITPPLSGGVNLGIDLSDFGVARR